MKNVFLSSLVLAAAIFLGWLMWGRIQEERSIPQSTPPGIKSKIDVNQILSGGPPKDGIPSIDSPKFWSREEAEKFLKDDDVVLGLEFEGEARAYPLRILNWHEIVNDTVNGKPVLVTYCPLCYTGIAFKREIEGAAVEFGVSGKLYNNNLLMYNRPNDSIEEENLWSQQIGEAVTGPLTGTKLEQIIIDTVFWKDWKTKYTDTKVLSTDTGHARNYNANPYGNYEFDTEIIFPISSKDDRLAPKAKIYGIEIDGKFKAYPQDKLKRGKVFTDELAGETIKISVDDAGRVRMTHAKTGQELVWQISFWFSWVAFHPNTEVYGR